MSDLTVNPVQSHREKRQFLHLPWELYREDPNWIPPLRSDQKEMVNYRPHPFYLRNEVQTFLALRDGRPCGRIAAILNHDHNERYDERRGFFGFFECIDDAEAATALFDAAKGWFAERGIHALRGPANPSQNYTLGLLIEGFDSPPNFMMTYNPPYYQRLVEGCGFTKAQDLYAYGGEIEMLPEIRKKLEPLSDKIREYCGVKIREIDKRHFLDDVRTFLSIYNRSLGETWGFVPMSEAEIEHMARSLRWLIVPQLALGAEIDGKLIGAVFGLLNYNPRIRRIDGRLFPFGFLRLLRNRQAIKSCRLISTNVLPEYQRLGVGLVLMGGLLPRALEWGLEEAEWSWVLESNLLSRGSLEKGGAKKTKTYRVYDLEF